MINWLNNRGVGAKLTCNAALIVLGLFLVTMTALFVSRGQMIEDRKLHLRAAVDVVVGYADALQADVAKGLLTREQAIDRFAEMTAPRRYNGDGYFSAYTMDRGIYVLNGVKPHLAGTDASKSVDSKGRHFVQDAMDLVRREGSGFYDLSIARPGSDVPLHKLNFAKGMPAWGIIVSSGMYLEDVDAALLHEGVLLGLMALPVLLLCAGCSLVIRRTLAGGLQRLAAAMAGLAGGDLAIAVPGQARRDEVGVMAGTVQVFKDGLLRARALEASAHAAETEHKAQQNRSDAKREAQAAELATVVKELAHGLSRLEGGDLTCTLQTPFAPAYDGLRQDFNKTLEQLREDISNVVSNTRAIATGTGEITMAADDLSRRTEQQAASLEQTAAALDLITATVRKTAEGAKRAREIVSAAQEGAQHSGEVVRDAIEAMSAIEASSHQISQIIGVIDEIAFQTNLLALNAGVEAARAGDSGRGFAVVAVEVRALAQRSAKAAKEIKGLISTSTLQVGRGVGLVGATGRSLAQIVLQVGHINGVVTEIAASTQEQSTALAEVNTAINQMDQVTQQNAAMVEQSTAACHGLAGDANNLEQLAGRFRTEPAKSKRQVTPQAPTSRDARPADAGQTSFRHAIAIPQVTAAG